MTHRSTTRPRGRGWPAVAVAIDFVVAVAGAAAPSAHAALTENLATSATAMSLGNAVTADPPGVESIHFNPAGLARLKGEQVTLTNFGASIRTSANFHQPADFDIGGWKDDPLNGTHTGPTRQGIYIPGIGMPHFRLPLAVVPGLGISFNQPGSPFTFGTMSYLTQAMSTDHAKDPNDPARFDGRLVHLQRLVYLSPAIGYKVSDTLSVGMSVPIAHASFVFNTDMRLPNTLIGITGQVQKGWCPDDGGNVLDTLGPGLCGGGKEGRLDPFKKVANLNIDMTAPVDPTINLGVLWEPNESFGLGVTYQSGSKTTYSGRFEINTDPMVRRFIEGLYSSLQGPMIAGTLGLPQGIPAYQAGNMTATIPFPSHWQVGVKIKPTKRLQFNVDANYTDWGSWDALTFKFDQSVKLLEMARMFGIPDSTQLKIPRGYRSVLHWGFGMQAQVSNKLTLRMGYEPRKSSVPGDKIDLVAPLPDAKVYSVGFNYKISRDTELNVGASYMKGDFSVPARGSCNINCDNLLNIIYNPYAGLDVSGGIRVRYLGMSYTKHFD
ncbi:OmpP1/FadL family transporter [Noviherbaspirillum galbum]|uniref:Outer membrane transport protein n=1 Tax=Noviherbaspirillum galbum TaxID=2709383 RepID=A0A6B3STX5_9BURK|nr:outer membrane protein transport protein [Noviherbaspirillum galbum]NEX64051.1 outer membrane transport protein [Noviherbaspirillum galbum]